jgi:hypothetical protein
MVHSSSSESEYDDDCDSSIKTTSGQCQLLVDDVKAELVLLWHDSCNDIEDIVDLGRRGRSMVVVVIVFAVDGILSACFANRSSGCVPNFDPSNLDCYEFRDVQMYK